jgi:hypothetical protein
LIYSSIKITFLNRNLKESNILSWTYEWIVIFGFQLFHLIVHEHLDFGTLLHNQGELVAKVVLIECSFIYLEVRN